MIVLSWEEAPCLSGSSIVVQMSGTSSNTDSPAAARKYYTTYGGMETCYRLPPHYCPQAYTHKYTTISMM